MSEQSPNLAAAFGAVQARLIEACQRHGRDPLSVRLLAVSKTRPAATIRAAAALGHRHFGENYVDEAIAKGAELTDLPLTWHFIGPVQSNKTLLIARHFDWVESVDRLKIVRRLATQRPADRPPLNVLIQVNLDQEAQKAGCTPQAIDQLADAIAAQDRLALRGLMAIPAPRDSYDEQRRSFARLHGLYEKLLGHDGPIDTLSAGMSNDLEAAIAEGSTEIRIGTDLFGPRR